MVDNCCCGSLLRRARGRKRYVAFAGMLSLGLVIMLQNTAVARTVHRPQMTGQQLIRDMKADPRVGQNAVKRERAMGYLDGVMDAGAGTLWCPGGKDIPHELNYEVADDIGRLGPEKLKENAATLVLAALAAHYPCKSSGGKQ